MARPTRGLAAALALALTLPAAAVAQAGGTITRELIAATPAATAYDVIRRIAPHWLATSREGRTVLYLNGSPSGSIDELSQIPAELVSSIEYLSGLQVNERLTGESARGVAAAIFVSTGLTPGRESSLAMARIPLPTVTFHYAAPVAEGASHWEDGMREWSTEQTLRETDGSAFLLSARFPLPPPGMFTDLTIWREQDQSAESWRGDTHTYANVVYRSVGAGLAFGRPVGPVRIGAGPALTRVSFTTSSGECACLSRRHRAAVTVGALVQATTSARVYGPLVVELRATAQRTKRGDVAMWPGGPPIPIGGNRFAVSAGVGVGRR